jgi:Mitochondrial PGP phosphatase
VCIFSNSAGLQQFDPEGQQMWTGFNCLDTPLMRQETLPKGVRLTSACGPAGHVAKKLEKDLGVPVLRHTEKKPAGGPEDLEKHFGWVLLRRGCQ